MEKIKLMKYKMVKSVNLLKRFSILLIFINPFATESQVRPVEKAIQQNEYFVPPTK